MTSKEALWKLNHSSVVAKYKDEIESIENDLDKLEQLKTLLSNAYNLEKKCVYLDKDIEEWLRNGNDPRIQK